MAAYSERYEAALILAARAHRDQTRKGSDVPYIVHPVQVSLILLCYGFSEEVAIAGLLHDVVEDQDVPLPSIEAEFGPTVAGIVGALTEWKREGGVLRPWEARKREALDQLRGAGREAAAVKAADLLHNCRTLALQLGRQGPSVWQHYSRGAEETLWYYRSAAGLVRARLGDHPLVREMDQALQALEEVVNLGGEVH